MTEIKAISTTLSRSDKWDHIKARWAINRMGHRVAPGLHSVGRPDRRSPVLVTANYSLSFDALRSSLAGIDAYILVLDTHAINVWCAAGKGTFGTEELVRRVKLANLSAVVDHRTLTLPQLGAPGVSAHEVKRLTDFKVEYGPVRAKDISEYLRTGKATPEMRRVEFTAKDRAVLIPVELVSISKYVVPLLLLMLIFGKFIPALYILAILLAGTVLFPLLLPYLPTREFTTKGLILGGLVSLSFVGLSFIGNGSQMSIESVINAAAITLELSSVIAFIALNFTGTATFTSRTGVRREIFRYIPVLAAMFVAGIALEVIGNIGHSSGWF